VPTFAKRFLIGAAILLAVPALILLCINVYLQSAGVQDRVRAAAADAMGVELRIRSTAYTPWEGLVLRDLSIPDSTTENFNAVEAAALRIRFSLLPLLQKRFVVTECTLFEPRLVIRQLENGNWVVPLTRRVKVPTDVNVPTTPGPEGGPSFTAELQRIRIGSGQIALIDARNRTVLLLERTDIDAALTPEMRAEGIVSIARMKLGDSLRLRRIESPFTWDGSALDVPQIQGELAGGQFLGSYHLQTGETPAFALTAELKDVLLRKLADEAGIEPGKTDGQLQGTLSLQGDPRRSEDLTGAGRFELLSAKLKPVEFLSKLGELFQIDELQLLKLSDAWIDLTIGKGRVNVDDFFLKSENLIIRGEGPIHFDGKLNLEAKLLINQKLHNQLKSLLGKNFKDSKDPEYREMAFTVKGTVARPKTDILKKLTGISLEGNVGGFLQNILQALPRQESPKEGN